MTTIHDTEKRLSKMAAGQRSWFSYCASMPINEPRLLLHFLREDPDSQKLSQCQKSLSDEPFIIGMTMLNGDGRLQFLAPNLSKEHLESMAEWVNENIESHSSLACLKDCVLNEVSSTGMILSQHEDESLWQEIPEQLVPYTMEESLYRLRKLKDDRKYWFWLTNKGPLGTPFFYLYPKKKSDSLRQMQKHLLNIRKQLDSDSESYSGAINRTSEELYTLISFDSGEAIFDSFSVLYQQDSKTFVNLAKIRIIHNQEGALSAIYRIRIDEMPKNKGGTTENRKLSDALKKLNQGKKLYFWFNSEKFLLCSDKKELRDEAKKIGKVGIRGEVRQSSKGYVVFQTKQDSPRFITSLARWTNKNRATCADLSVLKGARMTQRDEDGNIIDRQKEDTAWI
jgi:hypothetical protein